MSNSLILWFVFALFLVILFALWLWVFAMSILDPIPPTWESDDMSKERTGCKARQFSDQMMCGQCGLQWDMNDPEPPVCRLEDSHTELRLGASRMVSEFPKGAVDVYGDACPGQSECDDPLAEVKAMLNKDDDDIK